MWSPEHSRFGPLIWLALRGPLSDDCYLSAAAQFYPSRLVLLRPDPSDCLPSELDQYRASIDAVAFGASYASKLTLALS